MKIRMSLFAAFLFVLMGTAAQAQNQNSNNHAPTQSEAQILFSMIDLSGKMHQDAAQLGGTLQSLHALYYNGGNGNGVQNQINNRISNANGLVGEIGSGVSSLEKSPVLRGNRLIYGEVMGISQAYITWRARWIGWTNTSNPSPEVLEEVRYSVGAFKEDVNTLKANLLELYHSLY